MPDGFGYQEASPDARSIEWYTPPEVFGWLRLDFDLDPCSPIGGLDWIDVDRYYTVEDDGLSQPWEGLIWLNPPYGPRVGDWLRRLAEHGDGIALVPSRTETAWWQEAFRQSERVAFLKGRLTFVDSSGQRGPSNSGHGSTFFAYGTDCAIALDAAIRDRGVVVNGWCEPVRQGSLL